MSERQQQFSGTGDIRQGQEIDIARLSAWMADNVADFAGPLSVAQFKGGQSNPTYKLMTPRQNYVLRRKPPGILLPSAHAVDREYRVITALHGQGFPAPRTFGLCMDDGVIGTAFYIMDCVEGRVIWDATFPTATVETRGAYFDAMNKTIADLHMIDIEKAGLSDFGKPGNYFARQIGRWSRQYLEDPDAGRVPSMDRLVEWLPANIPPGDETSVVHGDYRCDNMIFHPTEPRVLAVLDWELSTLGHPLADFSYHLMMYRMPPATTTGLIGADLPALGIPTEAEYVAAYCRRTGRDGIADLDFYVAYNMFRLAGIIHGIRGRVIRGTAASAHAKKSAEGVELLADLAWSQAQKCGAR
ncbi:phosphotransferase family protein [Polymorphobacter fuscus]|uniref:Phosphotransferase n=1 Tax=Sandarakinorhabdus fusca TaxID=1439888 RepID=A0A7C9KYH9_9SPHN|nr:phosphotransferase family protein [Polymorphobacter fuscus]KAB7644494.1 phosphotransferase family protein [Polymorphobacter fuscus]MQT18422.1 phosphotransferase [Polymorphobacter fuscus]NJC08324.1 aminoglycoside phosphotransferase (APT) family kinase protein [Polymorphobacter fuscus]